MDVPETSPEIILRCPVRFLRQFRVQFPPPPFASTRFHSPFYRPYPITLITFGVRDDQIQLHFLRAQGNKNRGSFR
jgi:hypothetical protein